MGREVRKVPATWEHPRDEKGRYIPLYEHFPFNKKQIQEGVRCGWLKGDPPNYNMSVMPGWSVSERTHYQMYENITEGTPISPVMESQEKLARWLVDSKVAACPGIEAVYEEWLAVIKTGYGFGSSNRAAPAYWRETVRATVQSIEAVQKAAVDITDRLEARLLQSLDGKQPDITETMAFYTAVIGVAMGQALPFVFGVVGNNTTSAWINEILGVVEFVARKTAMDLDPSTPLISAYMARDMSAFMAAVWPKMKAVIRNHQIKTKGTKWAMNKFCREFTERER